MYASENRAERPPIYGILVGTMMNGHWVFMDFGASCFQSNTPQWLFLEINVGRYCVIMSWSFIHSSGTENTYMHTYVYVILYIIVSACMCVIHTSTQKTLPTNMKHLDPHRSDLAKFVSIWLIMIAPREFGTTTDLLWSTKYIQISIISLVCIVIRKILHGWSTIPFMWILFLPIILNIMTVYDPKKTNHQESNMILVKGCCHQTWVYQQKQWKKTNKLHCG